LLYVQQIFVVVARGLMEMLKNYYILRAAAMCNLASVLCKLLRSGTFGACIDPSVRKDGTVRGRLLEMGYELLAMLIGYQSQLKRTVSPLLTKVHMAALLIS
jgi:hypothetical protein